MVFSTLSAKLNARKEEAYQGTWVTSATSPRKLDKAKDSTRTHCSMALVKAKDKAQLVLMWDR